MQSKLSPLPTAELSPDLLDNDESYSLLFGSRDAGLSELFKAYSLKSEIQQAKIILCILAVVSIFNVFVNISQMDSNLFLANWFLCVLSIGGIIFVRRAVNYDHLALVFNLILLLVISAIMIVKSTLPSTYWLSYLADVMVIMVICFLTPVFLATKIVSAGLFLIMDIIAFRAYPEIYQTSDILSFSILLIGASAFSLAVFLKIRQANFAAFVSLHRERETNNELLEALNRIDNLQGMLPICAGCKKIRDDSGYWEQIESYISEHANVEFSHGMCPECMTDYYPKISKDPSEPKA